MAGSGEAAEQIVQISLQGLEYTVRLAGSGAKEVAAFLLAAAKTAGESGEKQVRLRGKERLRRMLESGKELKIFTVGDGDLSKFAREARRYGVAYCALRDRSQSGSVDIMGKAEDASKIARILEKLEVATVDQAERQQLREEKLSHKKEMRTEKRSARKAYRTEVRAARKEATQEFRAKRKSAKTARRGENREIRDRYREKIGKVTKTPDNIENPDNSLTVANPPAAVTVKTAPSPPSSGRETGIKRESFERPESVTGFLQEVTARNKAASDKGKSPPQRGKTRSNGKSKPSRKGRGR